MTDQTEVTRPKRKRRYVKRDPVPVPSGLAELSSQIRCAVGTIKSLQELSAGVSEALGGGQQGDDLMDIRERLRLLIEAVDGLGRRTERLEALLTGQVGTEAAAPRMAALAPRRGLDRLAPPAPVSTAPPAARGSRSGVTVEDQQRWFGEAQEACRQAPAELVARVVDDYVDLRDKGEVSSSHPEQWIIDKVNKLMGRPNQATLLTAKDLNPDLNPDLVTGGGGEVDDPEELVSDQSDQDDSD